MHRTYGCSANPHRSRPLCDFCGRKFCQPQKLKVHIKRMHSDFSEVLKEFQCKSCLKILGSRAALQRHSKEVHQKQIEDACSCARCGKRFQNKSNLKIHMLTHSGIKPFRCSTDHCIAAFTTKQCLQFHYKKVHNFTEENMPTIERSIDYTFQAYSGHLDDADEKTDKNEISPKRPKSCDDANEDSDNDSLESPDIDNPDTLPSSPLIDEAPSPTPNCNSPTHNYNNSDILNNTHIKVLSKGSKKWIADHSSTAESVDLYVTEKINKNELTGMPLQDTEVYNRDKHIGIDDFNRQETSNASLLVEAALDSVCSEPNIDIDVATTPNCSNSLVNNLYSLTQPEALPSVSYADNVCINETRDIHLISPLVNNHMSDNLNNEIRNNHNVRMDYSSFHQNDFDSPNSPELPRLSFVKHHVTTASSHITSYEKNVSTIPSPPRYDFGHAGNAEQLSSDDSNGMAAQNLSLHNSKTDIQLDLSVYKTSYKTNDQNYTRRNKFDNNSQLLQDQINKLNQDHLSSNMQSSKLENKETNEFQLRSKYLNLLSNVHGKLDLDLDLRLKSYDNTDDENIKLKNATYDSEDVDLKSKGYDLIDVVETRNKQYENVESDFRVDRNVEPLSLNSSELQGLDMSARSFHNYSNINRYHHLYPEVDRVDLRFNYSPPAATYMHSDILRVVSLDLTPPGRHSVDLSLRSHPLHQITNSRLLTEHGLPTNSHRLLDQSRLLTSDINSTRHLSTDNRLISDSNGKILSANDQLTSNHLLSSEQNRLIADNSRIICDSSRLLEQGRLIGESRILTPTGAASPIQGFNTYSVTQSPFHSTHIAPRQHMSSPTPYHYSSYY